MNKLLMHCNQKTGKLKLTENRRVSEYSNGAASIGSWEMVKDYENESKTRFWQ